MRRGIALAVMALVLVACSDDEPSTSAAPESSTTTLESGPTSTTESVPVDNGSCPNAPAGSSSSQFESALGTYAVQGVALGAEPPSVTFDVVQWLSGDDARRTWLADHPEDPDGPPNDYYIVNDNDRLRTAPVDTDATVRLTHLFTDATASVELDTLDGLGGYLAEEHSGDTYWLTFDNGVVSEICEQYRP
jgi:hypothetical protein